MSGIRTVEDLRGRCFVDDITGCWHWRGAHSGDFPCLWLPVAGKRTTMGRAIGWLVTGKGPGARDVWHVTCETKSCGNPEHRKRGTRQSQMLAAKLTRSVEFRARVAKSRTKKLDTEKAAAIRASCEPLRIVAKRFGVSSSTCSDVRRGNTWRELGVSVFSTWRRAA